MPPRTRPTRLLAVVALTAAFVAFPSPPGAAQTTCFGEPATIEARPGVPTIGTPGPDVIVGTSGPDEIDGGGGRDLICSLGGDDIVDGGAARDRIDLGPGDDLGRGGTAGDLIRGRGGDDHIFGNAGEDELVGGPGRDEISGGRHADIIRGSSGNDDLRGNKGPDSLDGGSGSDDCTGGTNDDTGRNCETVRSLSEPIGDDFAGTGALRGYTTNNASALPEVGRVGGRYHAGLTDNTGNVTLHYHGDQGRLDARLLEFPFDITVRNIGIGTVSDSQTAPAATGNPYLFAGVQVHVPDLDDTNSSHVVVGHRGGTHFTIEGKNTRNGSSSVNDAGANIAPDGRADIRIVGTPDRTLLVSWQVPNPDPGNQADAWIAYRGDGVLPGLAPTYPKSVYVGLITYAFGSTGVPFVGTADAIEATPTF